MKTGELIERIQTLYSKGVASQSSRLEDEFIYHNLITMRSFLITREARKRRRINEWNYQSLPCIEMIESNLYECDCLPQISCKLMRSKYKLPKPLLDYNQYLMNPVTSLEGSISFTQTTINNLKYINGNKYTSKSNRFFIQDQYLFATKILGVKALRINNALFEDPIEAANFPKYCDKKSKEKSCINPLEVDFPIDSNLIDVLITEVIKILLPTFTAAIEDITNDGRDDITQKTK